MGADEDPDYEPVDYKDPDYDPFYSIDKLMPAGNDHQSLEEAREARQKTQQEEYARQQRESRKRAVTVDELSDFVRSQSNTDGDFVLVVEGDDEYGPWFVEGISINHGDRTITFHHEAFKTEEVKITYSKFKVEE